LFIIKKRVIANPMNPELLNITEKIKRVLTKRELTLSAAESCTGGLISHLITSVPGASVFFRADIIAYSRDAKENILAVSGKTIDTFGMISSETAVEMAEKIRLLAKTDYSVSSTGNLGPNVLEGKEKGLVHLAACREGKAVTKKLILKGSRAENMEAASLAALNLLIELVNSENE
jgi:PncC family amidohydrolase